MGFIQLKNRKIALIAGTTVCAAALGAGLFVPVRIEVKQTGTLHQHTALTENDFEVQTSTLFGIKYDADDYKVIWNGWTEEQQEAVLGQANYVKEGEEQGESQTEMEAFALNKDKNIITPDDIRTPVNNNETSANALIGKIESVVNDSEKDSNSELPGSEPDKETGDTEASSRKESEDGEDEQIVVTGDTVTEYTISKGQFTDTVKADAVPVVSIEARYEGKVYFMDAPDPDNIRAQLVYEDGARVEVECTSDEIGKVSAETDVPVHTEYGDTMCHIEPVRLSGLTSEFKGKVYTGEAAEIKDVTVKAVFEDGYVTEVKATSFADDAIVNDPGDFRVNSIYGETSVHIEPVPITGASIEVTDLLYEEDMLDIDIITLTYEDGKKRDISKGEYELGAEATLPLTAGENEIPFIYNGKMYTFTVNVLHDTEIRRATMRYGEEIKTAEYSHLSDTIMVTVNRYTEAEYSYLLTHIIIDDPSQIHAGLSNDDYGGERETPSSASKRLGWVVGINGSNFDYASNTPTMADAKIKNGMVMPDSKAVANGMEICLTNSGNLFSPKQGMTINDLLNMGVTDTWCCGDTLLISNGEAVNVGIQSLDYRYPRTAIGMVRPCEYYLITAGSSGYSGGMTYDEVRDILTSHDCGFGKCLDGGGSSTLIFENQLLNSPAAGSERPVTDFLYFTE